VHGSDEHGEIAGAAPRRIRITAALIDDGPGRLLSVRKAGSEWFMQAGGKIERSESAVAA
jgi:8-oxo-dGTP diphosphatase